MNVYLVYYSRYDEFVLGGIFSSLEKAETAKETCKNKYIYIKRFELDSLSNISDKIVNGVNKELEYLVSQGFKV